MKKIVLITFMAISIAHCFAQGVSGQQINELVTSLANDQLAKEDIKTTIDGVIKSPDLYNTFWKGFIDQAFKKNDNTWKLLKDINLKFKTFDAKGTTPAALGFTYDYNYSYANFIVKGQSRISHSFDFSANGNVAFNKQLNPDNFLVTKIDYSYAVFIGGVVKVSDKDYFKKLDDIEDKLVKIKDMQSSEARALWEDFGKYLKFSNQYYLGISPDAGYESNQDFSKQQWTPGIAINFSAKGWDNESLLSKLNVLDYPFALLRVILGTDTKITPYGSTLPTIHLGFDYVIPTNDTTRNNLVGNLNPYPRVFFETNFKTIISRIDAQNIFFSTNYRFYKEINAPLAIQTAKLGNINYFVMALQSTSGLYVSYSTGKLPFDAKSDQVYSIGFNYKLDSNTK